MLYNVIDNCEYDFCRISKNKAKCHYGKSNLQNSFLDELMSYELYFTRLLTENKPEYFTWFFYFKEAYLPVVKSYFIIVFPSKKGFFGMYE